MNLCNLQDNTIPFPSETVENGSGSRTLKVVNLIPEIQPLIVNGKEPAGLTVARLRQPFPEEWEGRRKCY